VAVRRLTATSSGLQAERDVLFISFGFLPAGEALHLDFQNAKKQ